MIQLFANNYVSLQGERYQTLTLHIVAKHLADDVRQFGPLLCHSMFSIEGALALFRKSRKNSPRTIEDSGVICCASQCRIKLSKEKKLEKLLKLFIYNLITSTKHITVTE